MATNYPGSLDTSGSQLRTDIASTDDMNASGKEHHLMHVNVHGAAIALETKLGTGSSTASTGAVLMGTGSGASAWDTSPTILGALTVGADGSGHDVTFYSGTAGDSFVWDSSEEKLTITGTNGQVALAVADGNVTIADDLDVDGTLEADAITVNGTALSEYIADTVGAMVGSNTETNITVTYEDGDNTLDFVIGTLNQDTSGNAATATALETARTINGVSFDGTGNVTVTAAAGTLSGGTLASGVTASSLTSVGTLTGLVIADGSVSSPSLRFSGSTSDSGLYDHNTDQIGISSGGYTSMASTNGSGATVTGGTIATAHLDTASTSGYLPVYRNTSLQVLAHYTSKRATKDNIQSFSNSGSIIDALQPVTFVTKAKDGETVSEKEFREADIQHGFIAEEVAEVADGKFASYEDVDGSFVPNGWRQPDMISLVVAELKSVRQRLTALES